MHTLTLAKRRVALIGATLAAVVALMPLGMDRAHAAEASITLGTAESYSVLGASAVTNTGESVLTGDLGLAPGTGTGPTITGFPPGLVLGATHDTDDAAFQAQLDLGRAYDEADTRAGTALESPELGNRSFGPGVYDGGALSITGNLTLVGDANSIFIFRAASSLVTESGSTVTLDGVSPCNVYWRVVSSATLGTGSTFVGTVMASASITATTGANVAGRLLARNGAVTLDTNNIQAPTGCRTITGEEGAPGGASADGGATTDAPTSGTPTSNTPVAAPELPPTGAAMASPLAAGTLLIAGGAVLFLLHRRALRD
ncbi:MAG: hypothetical protein JWP30_1786 [Homoserinimonas sp.]|jgi:hypothetical protein|nr:hypothetical protein [Homoserinimonas sp.]